MTRSEAIEIFRRLGVCPEDEVHNVYDKLSDLGYNEDRIRLAFGADKICLVFEKEDFVIKFMQGRYSDDDNEALKEVKLYNRAFEKNIDMFFPKTVYAGNINGVHVVIQDKVDFSVMKCSNEKSHKYFNIGKTVSNRVFEKALDGFYVKGCGCNVQVNEIWLKAAISLYGRKIIKELCQFVQDYKINDLHPKNIGYKNDRPVFLDFSGHFKKSTLTE